MTTLVEVPWQYQPKCLRGVVPVQPGVGVETAAFFSALKAAKVGASVALSKELEEPVPASKLAATAAGGTMTTAAEFVASGGNIAVEFKCDALALSPTSRVGDKAHKEKLLEYLQMMVDEKEALLTRVLKEAGRNKIMRQLNLTHDEERAFRRRWNQSLAGLTPAQVLQLGATKKTLDATRYDEEQDDGNVAAHQASLYQLAVMAASRVKRVKRYQRLFTWVADGVTPQAMMAQGPGSEEGGSSSSEEEEEEG